MQIDVQVPVPFHLYLGAVDALCVKYTKVILWFINYKLGLQYNLQKKEIAWETVYDKYSCWTSTFAILASWGFYLQLSFQYL